MGPARYGRAWDLAAVTLGVLLVVAQIRFAILDARLPRDLNYSHEHLPDLFRDEGLGALLGPLWIDSAGWYNALLLAGLELLGRGPAVFEILGVFWLILILGSVALIARKLGGTRAGPLAGLLAIALIPPHSNAITLLGRQGWIHVPELALLLVAVTALIHDPGLRRRRSVLLIAVTGAAALALRLSCLIWIATLVMALGWSVRSAGWSRGSAIRTGVVLTSWSLGLLAHRAIALSYFGDKIDESGFYDFDAVGGGLLRQLSMEFSAPFAVAALVGVAVLVFRLSRVDRAHRPALALLLAWLLLPLLMFFGIRAGIANFPCAIVALAILGALGWSRLPRWLALPLILLWALPYLAQWLPQSWGHELYHRHHLARYNSVLFHHNPDNYYLVFRDLSVTDLSQLVSATCPPDFEECLIYVESSLFQPTVHDTSRLETFLAELDRVRVEPLWFAGSDIHRRPAAYVRYGCVWSQEHHHNLRPALARNHTRVVADHDLVPVWTRRIAGQCRMVWMTPDGELHRPDQLPEGDSLNNERLISRWWLP